MGFIHIYSGICGVKMSEPTDTQYQFMINAFTKRKEQAALEGDKETFENMQEQLRWLHNAQKNKYKN